MPDEQRGGFDLRLLGLLTAVMGGVLILFPDLIDRVRSAFAGERQPPAEQPPPGSQPPPSQQAPQISLGYCPYLGRDSSRYTSRGEAVLAVQQALAYLGFNPPTNVDGIFGSITESAVRSFQAARGIAVDGIVGPQTYGELDRALRERGGSFVCGQTLRA